MWQDIRCQRGDHAKAQLSAQDFGPMLSQVCQVAHCTDDHSGAFRDFDAKFREHWRARAPLDQLGTQNSFQFVDLHRKGRLTDRTLLRGSSEVLMTSKCIEIT